MEDRLGCDRDSQMVGKIGTTPLNRWASIRAILRTPGSENIFSVIGKREFRRIAGSDMLR